MSQTIKQILQRGDLTVTKCRIRLLEMFSQTAVALEHRHIEEDIGNQFDRVTIYRTLTSFLSKGIIHKIPTFDGTIKYGLCQDNCTDHKHHIDNHIHFICHSCGKTQCLQQVVVPNIGGLPLGFLTTKTDVILQGLCQKCNR